MKKYKLAVLIIFLIVAIKCVINILLCIPGIIAYASNNVLSTQEGKVIAMEKDYVTVSYPTESGTVSARVKKDFIFNADKKDEKIAVDYDKNDNTKVYNVGWPIIKNAFFLLCLYTFSVNNLIFLDIFMTWRTKKWEEAEFDYESTTNDGPFSNIVTVSHEIDGQKKMYNCLINSNVIEVLVRTGILNKVPVKVNPNNRRQVAINFNRLDEVASIKKLYI